MSGSIGTPDLQTLILQLMTMASMLGGAALIVDRVAQHCLLKHEYTNAKYEHTQEFGSPREGLLSADQLSGAGSINRPV